MILYLDLDISLRDRVSSINDNVHSNPMLQSYLYHRKLLLTIADSGRTMERPLPIIYYEVSICRE
jgi:hypothetical protein